MAMTRGEYNLDEVEEAGASCSGDFDNFGGGEMEMEGAGPAGGKRKTLDNAQTRS